jgi:hypothetical protein
MRCVRFRNEQIDVGGVLCTMTYREYEYHLPDGTEAAIAVTLCDLAAPGAELARQLGALAHGLIAVVGVPGIPAKPLAWIKTNDELSVLIGRDDQPIGDDLCKTIGRVLMTFFRDVHIDPDLAGSRATSGTAVRPSREGAPAPS